MKRLELCAHGAPQGHCPICLRFPRLADKRPSQGPKTNVHPKMVAIEGHALDHDGRRIVFMRDEAGNSHLVSIAESEVHKLPAARQRRYLPTFADLVDRLTIAQLKAVFIPDNRASYQDEIELILHDLDLILEEKGTRLGARAIHAIAVVMLTNRFIWENESKARAGGNDQDHLLKLTHSINGVRNTAKNVIAREFGERLDWKVDCFAAELIKQFGDWNIFGDSAIAPRIEPLKD